MKSGSAKVLELIERRLELVRTLIRMQGEWRAAFIGLKMDDSERCSAEEEILCKQIHVLDQQIASLQADHAKSPKWSPAGTEIGSAKPLEVDLAIEQKILAALGRMAGLQLELKRSNEIRRAILKRSELTINALRNLFNSYAPTYGAPAAQRLGTIYEENV
jgi:hypothetical protein